MTPTRTTTGPVLEIDDLWVEFAGQDATVHAVNGVSFHLEAGKTLAILGESGSGKSVTAQTIMGILDAPPARVTGGAIRFHGEDLLRLAATEQRAVRGPGIAMVFQDALAALNPVLTVGAQIAEMFRAHRGTSRKAAFEAAVGLLDRVGIPDAARRARAYPHQFSGGMRQRVLIAMALALDPDVLIADEPTTALDVTVQAQIMELLAELQRETGMALLLITHDLGVANETSDRVAVMYAGRIVEEGATSEVLSDPSHPYTRGLMASAPRADGADTRLQPITGAPPDLANVPSGCPFHPRCPTARTGTHATPDCSGELPQLVALTAGRTTACHYHEEV